ncbi:MAG: radical SAM protein [Candidatus Omnitrophica bacterium]|nr:radical SAM protein [Candidatus Omnitrophota bacterium]MBU4477876.1 radical SAM protein [Candidatus Omnitrophota bacterium]MCG2704150.1 radical SAM protein [Candidatus Omnitrophota bacterium]
MNYKEPLANINTLDCCDLGIAYQCNYKCRMCHFWQNNPLNEDNVLSIEEWKEVLKQLPQLPKNDNLMVNFAGPGETFLRKGIFSLIKYGRQLKLKIQVISNGSLISEDICREISDAGLEFLCLSLDSLNPKTHDYLRGVDGAQERVLQAIENMARYSSETKIGINTVINGMNLDEIAELTEWAQRNERISHINFQAITQPFSFTEASDELWFKDENKGFLWPLNESLIHKTIDCLIGFKGLGYKIADSVQQLNNFREYFLNPLQFIKNGRCNLGKGNVLIIDPAGNVSICSLVGIIDNLRKQMNLSKILSSEDAFLHKKNINVCRRNCHLVVSCYYQEE